ncbi:choice-of-anchor J domain-containing protein [Nostoc ellipsosporum NOK]|nr:choice-of-anchor J domain-containing protein [Nostoc ellipsosporum NOK]
MRKIYLLFFSLLSLLAVTQNASAQLVVTIPSANTNTGSARFPLGNWWGFERSASIYTPAQIGLPGTITKIAYYVNSVSSPANVVSPRIYMKHRTTLFSAGTTYASETTGATLVYGPTNIPSTNFVAGQWVEITLATPFLYNGTDNLEVITEVNAGGGGNEGQLAKQFRYSTATNCFQGWTADNTAPAGNGTVSGNRPNIQFTLTVPPCVPGSLSGGTISAPAAVCPGTNNLTITASGGSVGAGLTYQWQSAPAASGPWTDIPSATTGGSVTVTQTATTFYRRKMTCSGTDAYSNEISVGMNGPLQCYCIPTFPTGTEPITLVNFAGINNTSSAALSSPAYENFTALTPAALFKGQAHPITIKGNTDGSFTSYIAAYFDWNQDGDFDDAGEAYYLGTIANSTGTDAVQLVATITPPATALDGNTRMRITKKFGTSGQAVSAAAAPPCNNAGYGQAEDYTVNVSTPLCALPSNLTASSPIPVGAILSWTAASPAPGATGGYEWAVTSTNTSATTNVVSSGTTPDNVTTTANATGLTANTIYYAWVRTHCGGGVYSPWTGPVQFKSACNPTTLPYVQKFDAITPPAYPDCFTVQNVNGGLTWETWTTSSGLAANSQPNSIRCTVDASGPADDWFFLPAFNLTGGTPYYLSFAYKGSDVGFITRMEVKYGNAPNAAAMTNTLFTNNNITSSLNDPWAFQTNQFTPAASGIYYIGFHCTTPANQGWLYVDDIGVELCPTPTNVNAIGITPTSAVVNFNGSATNYVVEYGPVGFTPGTGATAGGGTIINATASPVIISSGLTAATTYDVYVRAICGANPSGNTKGTLTTLCPATNIAYLQNMETATPPLTMPTCTSKQDANGNSGAYDPGDGFFTPPSGGGGWESYTSTSNATYVSATKSVVYRYDASNTTRGADDWFYLQGLNLTAGTAYRLKFYYKASDGPTYFEKLQVTYGTAAYAPAQTNVLWTNNNIVTNINTPFDSATVDFTPAATGVYYIGFHAMSSADMAFLYLDDVSVKLAPKVDVGVTAVPLPSLTCPTDGVFLQATVRNFNTTTQNFATYPVTVKADITGAATGSVSATINTGTLAPGASTTIYLSPAFNFNVGGTYNIKAYTSSPDDPEVSNDTLRTSVSVNPFPVAPVVTPAAPAICVGSTVQLSTQYTPPPPPATATATSGTISVTIPDNGAAGATNALTIAGIPAGASIISMTVTANVAHIWVGDIVANLRAPNGKVLNLINQKGGSGVNLTNTVFSSTSTTAIPATGAPYTGTYRPDAAIGVGPTGYVSDATGFSDLFSTPNGTWTIALRDMEALITGRLTSWTINITYGTLNPTVTWAPVTGLFTDAAATVPYTAGTNALSVYAKPTQTTTYTVTATGAGPCTRTANVTVTVNPLPTVTIGSLPDTVCISDQIVPLTATPAGGVWSGIGVSGNNFIPPATAIGTYTLRYTYNNQFNCSASATRSIAVKDCPERYNQLRDDAVILWPNPSNGQFNIRINSVLYDWLSVRIYTATGELVGRKDLSGLTFGRVIPFDYSHLAGGVYFVQFYYKNGDRATDKTFKIIVGHN